MRPSFFSAQLRPALIAPWSADNGSGPVSPAQQERERLRAPFQSARRPAQCIGGIAASAALTTPAPADC